MAPDPASSQVGIATLALTPPLTLPLVSDCWLVSIYAGAGWTDWPTRK